MEYGHIRIEEFKCDINYSCYGTTGSREIHAIITLDNVIRSVGEQFNAVAEAVGRFSSEEPIKNAVLIWKRYFLSDPVNQRGFIPDEPKTAVSIVGQPPLDYTKVALWCYWAEGAVIGEATEDGVLEIRKNGISHYFHTALHSESENEYDQTADIFRYLTASLSKHGMTLSRNLIRTWIFVQGVDTHYAGMVKARKAIFDSQGLTDKTHYVASTGIEGSYTDSRALVFVDSYSVSGLPEKSIRFLYAPANLSPTHKYGVTFERGTVIDFDDRSHIFISGTASIDKYGEIVAPLDIISQTSRTLENILALLDEAGSNFGDIAHLIVYLRDTADYKVVKQHINSLLPDIPKVYLLAPVCRPGWLIEIECMAVRKL